MLIGHERATPHQQSPCCTYYCIPGHLGHNKYSILQSCNNRRQGQSSAKLAFFLAFFFKDFAVNYIMSLFTKKKIIFKGRPQRKKKGWGSC